MLEGIINIDKPSGMTSHDVVSCVRRKFGIRRVGHAGTLDPLATGVLIVFVGKATKLSNQFMGWDKSYSATLLLGRKTDTQDIDGKVILERDYLDVTREKVTAIMKKYEGNINQMPPMYSAVKVNGRKLYEYARKGIEVKRTSRPVTIYNIELRDFALPKCDIDLVCSKGTYVRQLADDIGEDLGCGACITSLRRTSVGSFVINNAIQLESLNETHIRHWGIDTEV